MKRPEITKEIIRQAAEKTAEHTSNLSLGEKVSLAEALTRVYDPGMDGYAIARALERHCHWEDINTLFVEDVDAMGTYVDRIHNQVCWNWVKSNNIQPPLEIGRVLVNGVITAISTYIPACFEVKLTGHDDERDGFTRRLIKFEDAVLNNNPLNV